MQGLKFWRFDCHPYEFKMKSLVLNSGNVHEESVVDALRPSVVSEQTPRVS